jgi:hypothetical protein
MTAGLPSWRCVRSARLASVSTWASSSVRSMARTSSGVRVPSTFTRVRRSDTICLAGVTPTSAVIRTSSISSQVSSSSRSLASRPSSAAPKPVCDLASRARSRIIRPADGGGFSTTGGAGGSAGRGTGGACVPAPVSVPAVSVPVPGLVIVPVPVPEPRSSPARPRRTPRVPRGRSSIVPPTPKMSTPSTTIRMMYPNAITTLSLPNRRIPDARRATSADGWRL